MKDTDPKLPADAELEVKLQDRWLLFWQRIGADGNPQSYFDDLKTSYTESHRAYHTLRHIDHCLTELEGAWNFAQNPEAIEMAVWFHDIIYERAADNEERSAEYAMKVALAIGLSEEFATEVSRLILTTKHLSIPEDNDARILADIDIAILGQAPDVFDRYEDNVRIEYNYIDDASFAKGRSAVMKLFSDRERIYSTDFFRDRYEEQARANLARSISRWAS